MTTPTPELGFKTADQLSFVTQKRGHGGTIKYANFFDVPDESFSHGAVTGAHAALELLNALKVNPQHGGAGWVVGQVIAEAFLASHDGKTETGFTSSKHSRRGAAWAFLEVVQEAVFFLAKQGNYPAFVSVKIEQYERLVESEKEENKERTARAIAARKAKRIAKTGGAE